MTESGSPQTYFVALGEDRYRPTEHSGGAWRDDELHLAPVVGLLVHHLERWRERQGIDHLSFSRISVEVLGQIAREEISLTTEVVRPGRTIELVETTGVIGDRVTLRARAWLLQRSDTADVAGHEFDAMPVIDECEPNSMQTDWGGGFIETVETRAAAGRRPGRGRVWVTAGLDLVAGEPSQPLAEFAKVLDVANGIVIREDPTTWMYPNVDFTLHLFGAPRGRWVGLDTRVAFGSDGIGLTSSVVHDHRGPVGTLQQSLTLRRF